jgi:hypothetical protein
MHIKSEFIELLVERYSIPASVAIRLSAAVDFVVQKGGNVVCAFVADGPFDRIKACWEMTRSVLG